MSIRERIAKLIAPALRGDEEVRTIVAEEISRAKAALPITASYDPHGEGYRPIAESIMRRDLMPVERSRMFEIAYYMYDASAMFRRLAILDRSFLFAGKITAASPEPAVQEIIDRFWNDPENAIALKYPEKAMWLSILGEQCWPVTVNPMNGHVRLRYEDPSLIREVYVNPENVEQAWQVEMMGLDGRSGRKYAIIRPDYNIRSKSFGRLVGDCFFLALNHPPNVPRGKSDFLTLFDWIDSLERYGYNYLERAEFLLNFVWDVTLKGMDENQIREWLRNNPPPEPGSIRAHNEQVEWDAVAPDIKAADFKGGFDLGKSFVMGAAGRPASWFGEGGKAYQTEADQFGQVPVADLEQRQEYHRYQIEQIVRFAIDQAVIAGRLSPEKAAAGFTVNMPEVSKKDLTKLVNGIPQFVTALTIAENQRWVRRETATRSFAYVSSYLGYEIDADAEIAAAAAAPPVNEMDYADKDDE